MGDNPMFIPLDAAQEEVLRARARRLARPLAMHGGELAPAGGGERYLAVRILHDRCGLPLACVNEVIPLRSIVPVPNASDHVVGLVRHRGEVLAMVDLRRFWYGIAGGQGDSDNAVICVVDGIGFGIICSQIEGVVEVAPGDVLQPPENFPEALASCLRGVAHRDIMLVDLKVVLRRPGFAAGSGEVSP